MKKVFFLTFLLLPLGSCSSMGSNYDNGQTETIDNYTAKTVQSNSENQENLSIFEEKEKIATIFSPDDYKITELVDNSEKRILLFSKYNQNLYKSIFIKSTNFLKIIDLKNNEKEIFDGSI